MCPTAGWRGCTAFGGLDILVTNAGGPPSGAFESFNEAALGKEAIDLSLMSHVRLIRASLPYLRQSKAASVADCDILSVKQPIPNCTFQQYPGCKRLA